MTQTVTILIGNSDDGLTQKEWSEFYRNAEDIIRDSGSVQFSGPSVGAAPWQNACWVVVLDTPLDRLRKWLVVLAQRWRQDSIAIVVGETEFVESRRGRAPDEVQG